MMTLSSNVLVTDDGGAYETVQGKLSGSMNLKANHRLFQ